jgi:hypothetical protein
MSSYRFVSVRISTRVSKIIYCTFRLLEADPGGQPGADLEVIWNMPYCISYCRFVRARISILMLKIISGA